MARDIHYFSYGTLQQGLSNYADMTDVLGEPRGRFRTVDPFAVVVPHERGCANPDAACCTAPWGAHDTIDPLRGGAGRLP